MPTNDASRAESIWSSMTSAIVGSASYALQGEDRQQVEVLTEWLRQGERFGYEWRETYRRLYAAWAHERPLLPPPAEMERRVLSRDAE